MTQEVLREAQSIQEWTAYREVYDNWKVSAVRTDVFKDKFINWLRTYFEFFPGLLFVPPNHVINWHTDVYRGFGVNLLLNPDCVSYSIITRNYSDKNTAPNFEYVEVPYKENKFTVLNVSKHHMVLNCDKPRYLFSLEFVKQKEELSYIKFISFLDAKKKEWSKL